MAPRAGGVTAPQRLLGRLLSPAVVVMNRLSYPSKFVLISVLFTVPLGYVMYELLTELNANIGFSAKERVGLQYLRPLRQLMEDVPQARQKAWDLGRGQIGVRPDLLRLQIVQIDRDIADLAAAQATLGPQLETGREYALLQASWKLLSEKTLSLSPDDNDILYTKLLENVRRLISLVGDQSNLILDPDLDTYYLMDSVLLKLPEQQELLPRAALFGKGVIARGSMSEREKAELIVLMGLLR